MSPPSRRALLRSLGAGLAAGVAGCESGPRTDSPTDTPAGSSTDSPTRSPTSTETGTATDEPTPATPQIRCGPAALPEAAWPVPDRSPARDRHVPGWDGFGDPPEVAWTARASPPEDVSARPQFSRPVVADEGLYVVEAYLPGTMVDDPGGHKLQARDPATGDVAWSYELPAVPAAPAVWGDLVLVPAVETLYAVDRSDGTERWTREFDSNAVSALPAGELAYVRVAGTDRVEASLHALTPDGSAAWTRSFDGGLVAGPTVGADAVYVGARDGTLFAVDHEGGAVAWTAETPQEDREDESPPFVSSVTATECGVYLVTDGDVVAFDDEGLFAWRAEGDYGALATDGQRVYAATSDGDRSLVRALDAVTGEQRWETATDVDTFAPAVVTDAAMYARSGDGVVAIDPGDGQVRWRKAGAGTPAAFANGTLYATDADPREARLEALR